MQHDYARYVRLIEEAGGSFYLFERHRFIQNIHEFGRAFQERYPNVMLAHSYKTNYTPALCRIAAEQGLYAEVVSGLEYSMALRVGYAPQRIIFNGPIKTKHDLEQAVLGGSMVNIDHLAEVADICEIARTHSQRRLEVGIRCNADYGAPVRSRFGLAEDSGELEIAFEQLRREPNITVGGAHVHTSAVRTPESYRKRADLCVEVVEKYFRDAPPTYLNLGGGIPGRMPEAIRNQLGLEPTDWNVYAEAICSPLGRMARRIGSAPRLILEPGIALFADVFRFCATVLAVKRIGDRNLAVLSGGVHEIKPTGHALNMPVVHVPRNQISGDTRVWELTGSTCMEHDVVHKSFEGAVGLDDIFVFDQVGAYTTVFKPPFIQAAPAIIELEGDGFRVLRNRETLDQMLATYDEVYV